MPLTCREVVQTASLGTAYDVLSPDPARPERLEADNALVVVRRRVIQLRSKLSDCPGFSGGMPTLPFCVVASAVRREFIALSDIDTSLLALGAAIGALVVVAGICWPQVSRISLKTKTVPITTRAS
jgi:hypothetical protein